MNGLRQVIMVQAAVFFCGCMMDQGNMGHGSMMGQDWVEIPAGGGPAPASKAELLVRGQTVFAQVCATCHGPQGLGIAGQAPPLAASDYFLKLHADRRGCIETLISGLSGPIVVNGRSYDAVMPAVGGEAADIAAVLTYVLSALNGLDDSISVAEVTSVRESL